jgi:WhiB family transcriptional regulator, redox-sensing transcriptional regulator
MAHWMHRAACRDADPELFFPISEFYRKGCDQQIAEAKTVCGTCPVIWQCLDYAVQNRIDDGIYGGLTSPERRILRALEIQPSKVG